MQNLNVVLINPQIPQNTGNIARTCVAVDCKLHIVHPIGFKITDKNVKRAGLDYWDKLNIYEYENLDHFFDNNSGDYFFFSTKAKNKYTDISYKNKNDVYLFFGREDAGIDEKLLYGNQKNTIRIPMVNDFRSLNLSNSVAIAVYEVLRQTDFKNLSAEGNLTKFNWN